jgi:hypothetical protein
MNRPRAAIRSEVFRPFGVPITRLENGLAASQELFRQFTQGRHDFVSVRHGQRSARAEIVLHVDND